MCDLSISVKNSYIEVAVKNKIIRHLTSPVLSRYIKVTDFDRESGVVSLIGHMNFADGTTSDEEDWIDLNDMLGFAFRDPRSILNQIDTIRLV